VEARLDTGDRTVYLAEVMQSGVTHFAPPLTVQRLSKLAPAVRLAELKRQLHRDGEIDAEAIRQWRAEQQERVAVAAALDAQAASTDRVMTPDAGGYSYGASATRDNGRAAAECSSGDNAQ